MYKVGDRVRLTSKRPAQWANNGIMDRYLGLNVTITRVYAEHFEFDGDDHFIFRLTNIVGYSKNHNIVEIINNL